MHSLHHVISAVGTGKLTCAYKFDVLMKNYTSFRIGGSVKLMFFPANVKELTEVYDLLKHNDLKPFILGRGTNLLVDDKPLDIVVINTLKLDSILEMESENEIVAASGVGLNTLAVYACNKNLTGLEFAHGIPGTVGGGIKMNAGAYGGEIKDVVSKASVIDIDGDMIEIEGADFEFGYRYSRFTDTDEIITRARFKLNKADKKNIKAKMDDYSERRQKSQPLDIPSAGSIFKRPEKGYAADLIEKAGLKGYTIGGAQISKKHSGFIVNLGDASFNDVMAVIDFTQEEIYRLFNIKLEPEIKIIS